MPTNQGLYEKIQEAKAKIGDDAVQLIADHFHLENFSHNGNIIKASCPFGHIDKTPSFIWNAEEKYFHCFSCGKNYGILDLFIDEEKNTSKAIKKLFQMADIDYKIQIKEDNDDFFEGYCFPPEETNTDRTKVEKYCKQRGISTATLDAMGVKQDKHGNVVFELRDLDDRLLSIKYRPTRSVKKGEAKMWWYQEKDAHGNPKRSVAPSLFNMNKVDFTKPLLITEGYFDALACYEAGYKNVVSIYGGAEDDNWIQFNFDFLEQFQEIILWYDNDRAGKTGLDKAISRLGEYRCKIVTPAKEQEDEIEEYFHLLGVKSDIRKTDANNVLLACGKEAVLSLINNAKEIPSKRLKYLMDYEPTNVKDMEKVSTGFKSIDKLIYGNLFPCFTIWSGYAGCVDADTEYFNGREWKRIADYKKGDMVLQYNPSGQAELVVPQQYHKYPATQLWHFKTKYGLDQCLSDEHHVYYITSKGNLYSKKFGEIRKAHEQSVCGFTGKFITTYNYSGNGIDLTDAQIKLMCAVICDGSFYSKSKEYNESYKTCRFHIKKERKKNRLRELFAENNLEYREVQSVAEDYTDFYVTAPRREKEFSEYWYNCSQHQLQVICDNILFWDGSELRNRKCFATNSKTNADFVQFAFTACGYRASLLIRDRRGRKYKTCGKTYMRKSVEYEITISNRTWVGMTATNLDKKIKIEPYQTKDGFKYCFTTNSHMWVMRRNGKIVVTGNSGKSSLANIACLITPVEYNYKVFVYSGELDNGQLSDWIFSPLAGIRHTLMFDNPSGRPSYAVSKEALKCIRDFYRTKFILYDDEDGLDSSGETVLHEMENAYRKYNCRVFLIDNLMTLSFEQLSEDSRWETQKKFIKKLMGFTKKYNVNVNLIVHPKKPPAGATLEHSVYDLHGASEIGNLCHRLIWIDRLKDDDFGYNTKISIVKDRPSQAAGRECKLYYDYATRRLYSDEEELEKGYEWENHYTITYSNEVEQKRLCNIPKEQCDQF